MSKPKFVFLGMDTCGHCVHFKNSPTPETSVWAQLVKDKELQQKVDFVFIKHGYIKDEAGNQQLHKLPEEYAHVKYGPYFQLQAPDYATGDEYVEMTGVTRTPQAMKTWIQNTLKAKPQLSRKKPAAAVAQPVPTPSKVVTVQPVTTPPQATEKVEEVRRTKFGIIKTSRRSKPTVETPVVHTRKFIPRNK